MVDTGATDIGSDCYGARQFGVRHKMKSEVEMKISGFSAFVFLALLIGSCTIPLGEQVGEEAAAVPITPKGNRMNPSYFVDSLHVEKDFAQWSLPTEVLVAQKLQNLRVDVEGHMTEQCMHSHGYVQFIRPRDASAPNPETSPRGRRIFTVEIARKYGYHEAPDPGRLNEDILKNDPGYESQPVAFHDQWAECRKAVRDEIRQQLGIERHQDDGEIREKTPLQSLLADYDNLSVDTFVEPLESAKQQWQQCMSPLGIADLPDEPWMRFTANSLPASLAQQWGWDMRSEPTVEEIRVAIHDAQCREESRWNELYYEAEWEMASVLVQGKEDMLAAYHDEQIQTASLLLDLKMAQ